jgi:hypothetical protein
MIEKKKLLLYQFQFNVPTVCSIAGVYLLHGGSGVRLHLIYKFKISTLRQSNEMRISSQVCAARENSRESRFAVQRIRGGKITPKADFPASMNAYVACMYKSLLLSILFCNDTFYIILAFGNGKGPKMNE